MPAKWQQWMPLHIDKWRGSPAVRSMHPAARSGYLDLLLSQWQSDDCTLSAEHMDLAELSCLGDKLWATYGARIIRNFERLENGRLRNLVCFEEWREAKRIFEARKKSADRTNTARWSIGDPSVTDTVSESVTDASASRRAHTITGTLTTTEKQEQKPSPAEKRGRGDSAKSSPTVPNGIASPFEWPEMPDPAPPPVAPPEEPQPPPKKATKTELAKSRHAEFKAAILRYWEFKNPGVEMPWGPAEGKNLEMWLRESPTTTVEQFTEYLRNRAKSDVNHSDRPSVWIRNVTSYATRPLNQFKIPKDVNAGSSQQKIKILSHPTVSKEGNLK